VTCGSRAKSDVAEAAAKTKESASKGVTGEANRVSRVGDIVSDDDLARWVRQGDDAAWDVLVKRYNRPVFRVCWRSTGNSAVAEDLTQDVWLRVWKKRESIRDGGFIFWVFDIARKICIDRARKDKIRRETTAEPEDAVAVEDAHGAYINVPDKANLKIFAEELLAILPEKERRVLLKRFVEGMTQQAVAESEGCSDPTIKVICARATARIRAHLSRGNAV
jgi:RNA polymerase sigma-70 factor (ECF subfamily)